MNLSSARIVLRPRALGEVLDLALGWCFVSHRGIHARLAACVLLPSMLLCVAARYALQWSWLDVWLLAGTLATFSQGVFTICTGRSMFDSDVRAGSVLMGYVRRFPSYFGAILLSRIVIALGALVIVLAPLAWMAVVFVHEASLLEMQRPAAAVARAHRMTRRRSGEALVLLIALGLAMLGFVVVVELLGQGLVEYGLALGPPHDSLFDDGGSVFALLGFHLAIPYVAAARFFKYVDDRTRSDGWDIQLRFMGLLADHEKEASR